MSSEHSNLSTVHKAVTEASLESMNKVPKVTASYKIDPKVKEDAERILAENGTDLSTYLRKCCELLVEDYRK